MITYIEWKDLLLFQIRMLFNGQLTHKPNKFASLEMEDSNTIHIFFQSRWAVSTDKGAGCALHENSTALFHTLFPKTRIQSG